MCCCGLAQDRLILLCTLLAHEREGVGYGVRYELYFIP